MYKNTCRLLHSRKNIMRPTKFDTLALKLEEMISVGKVGNDGRLPSQNQIAEQFKTSRSCVDKALNVLHGKGLINKIPGRGNFVSALQKQRPKMLKSLIYLTEWDMRKSRTEYDNFGIETMFGIEDECKQKKISFILRSVSPSEYSSLSSIARESGADGALLRWTISQEHVKSLASAGFTAVCVDNPCYLPGIGCSIVNYHDSYIMLTAKLEEAGVRKIAFLYPKTSRYGAEIDSTVNMIRTSRPNLKIAGIDFSIPGTDYDADRDMEMLKASMSTILEAGDLPEVIICNTDYIAEKLLDLCKSHGLSVPEDIQIIGGLGLNLSRKTDPPLSTLEVAPEELGRKAVQILWEMVMTGTGEKVERVPMEYKRGGTCTII